MFGVCHQSQLVTNGKFPPMPGEMVAIFLCLSALLIWPASLHSLLTLDDVNLAIVRKYQGLKYVTIGFKERGETNIKIYCGKF